ncbi:ABC transporter ATP-binding protein [Bacillus wiedmannii]|uniref:ABC transporter ATP-binding protein n=1 Tax=Bacillus wiedmannii TaxID=1890302 RepID=UPI00211D1819|nr:ATP-binding cassette domain-containing protein [Bacillus wiedmannii]
MIEVFNLSKSFNIPKKSDSKFEKIISPFYKKYEQVEVVKDLNFSIDKGEIVGFIGKNGAGKSTTIKMLTGVLTPSKGKVKIDGYDPYKQKKKILSNIGVVFGQRTQLWWDLPLIDSFQLIKKIYDVNEDDFRIRLEQFNDILNLDQLLHKPIRLMSLGQRMRADIAASLLHNPKVLFLDEPTIGLDLEAKENILNFIKEFNAEKDTTIILTTHDMADIEKLSNRLIIIDEGQIYFDGSLNRLKSVYGRLNSVRITSKNFVNIPKEIHSFSKVKKLSNHVIEVTYQKKDTEISQILFPFLKNNEIKDIQIIEEKIEDIVSELYKGSR